MPKYLVKLNEKAYIGGDLCVSTFDDIVSPYPPEFLNSIAEAKGLVELYGGRVVELCLIDTEAKEKIFEEAE